MQIKVIGITGPAGAGKGECIKYMINKLSLQGWKTFAYSLSDEIRREAKRKKLKIERSVLRTIGNNLRENFGNGILALKASNRIKAQLKKQNYSADKIIFFVDSIRNSEEIIELRKTWEHYFLLLGINAPIEMLANRIRNRERYDENKKVIASSDYTLEMIQKELGKDEPSHGHNISDCLNESDFIINNSKKLTDLYSDLDKFILSFILK